MYINTHRKPALTVTRGKEDLRTRVVRQVCEMVGILMLVELLKRLPTAVRIEVTVPWVSFTKHEPDTQPASFRGP
jgi:hypothetical protein